jgi:hypothetical protein
MRNPLRILCVLFGIGGVLIPANATQLSSFSSGPWQGGAFGDDRTSQFNSCVASTSYQSGITMHVMVDKGWQWSLGFSSDAWNLQKGASIALQYRFESTPFRPVTGTAVDPKLVLIPMPVNGSVVTQFRRGRTMEIHDANQSYFFDLTGTSRLLLDLAACVQARLNGTQTAGKGFGASSATPPSQQPQAPDDPALKLEGTRVLSNFLINAGIADAKILGPEDTPADLKIMHAVAIAPNKLGFVMVVPESAGISADKFQAEFISAVSEKCTGKFASGSSRESVEGGQILKGFTACSSGQGTNQLRYVLAPRSTNGLLLIGLSSNIQTASSTLADEPSEKSKPEVSDDLLRDAAFRASK